jgi:hypothetical protein
MIDLVGAGIAALLLMPVGQGNGYLLDESEVQLNSHNVFS